jgi:uncharacterized protein YegJ (DUF2314 family)
MKTTYSLLLSVLLVTGFFSCEKKTKEVKDDKTQVVVDKDEVAMDTIRKEARATVEVFLKTLWRKDTTKTDFAVKYPFRTDEGSEVDSVDLWLEKVEHEDGKYFGYLSQTSMLVSKQNIWDRVEFDPYNISDWKYVDKGNLVGGKSIIYFYNQMTDDEKKKFKEDTDFKF